ncbi:lytic transglycosylase domain-containing protein [Acinetobacter rathckeae]|uniref:lytic transglycosylase domain-containing protein n=1 Tax=Acinetobacter rathckeae TaxID=2605272 RepID=UPI00396A277B
MRDLWVQYKQKTFRYVALTAMALSANDLYASNEQFNDALNASNRGNSALLDQYVASMQSDVLGYYPEYFQLNTDLATQPSSRILAFIQKYPDSAMAEKLAADYVEEKVKIADFVSAQPIIRYVSNPDAAEKCAVAQVRAQSGDDLVFAEFKDLWLSTSTQPDSCLGLIRMMLNSPIMTAQDKQQRVWEQLRAGQIGLAVSSAQGLGLNLTISQLMQIQNNPLGYLWSAPKTNDTDYSYLIFALGRLADTDLNTALTSVSRTVENTPPDVQKYLYRTVAYIGGTSVLKNNFNRAVLDDFDASYGLPFSPEEAEIYARQAIRFSAWESLIRAISVMSVTQQQEDRWQYWLARAEEKRNDDASKQQAQAIYQNLAKSGDDYHNLLAQEHIGKLYNRVDQATASESDQQRLAQDLNFNRAFALKQVAAPASFSTREWNWAVRQAYLKQDDGLILAAAQKAALMGWYDRAIYAADRTVIRHNYNLRYLTPNQNAVLMHSANVGLDPAWAYGLMRQESRFVTSARSNVGAGGLMQIMPNTAKLVAKQMGETYTPLALSDMNTNVRYGTYYLSMIQSQLSGNAVLATAGYNAGPNRALRWQPTDQALVADQYVETIPIDETRNYVKNVMTNTIHYGAILGQGNQYMSKWMKPIPLRGIN